MIEAFYDWVKYLPFTIPSVAIWWVFWTFLDAWYGGRLIGATRSLKRRLKGQKKPGRKAKDATIKKLEHEIRTLKGQVRAKAQIVTTIKRAVKGMKNEVQQI